MSFARKRGDEIQRQTRIQEVRVTKESKMGATHLYANNRKGDTGS